MPTYVYFYATQRTRTVGVTDSGHFIKTGAGFENHERRFRARNDKEALKRAKKEGLGKIYRIVKT